MARVYSCAVVDKAIGSFVDHAVTQLNKTISENDQLRNDLRQRELKLIELSKENKLIKTGGLDNQLDAGSLMEGMKQRFQSRMIERVGLAPLTDEQLAELKSIGF